MKKLRKFKFVGSHGQALDYIDIIPVVGGVYQENEVICGSKTVLYYAKESSRTTCAEWEEVFEEVKVPRKFKFVGNDWDARQYDKEVEVGEVYNDDYFIGESEKSTLISFDLDNNPNLVKEWEEVFEEEDSSQTACDTYCVGSKDFISVNIITYEGGKEINVNFSTNDLKYLKDFVNTLS